MDNRFLQVELARMRREDDLARAEHERMLAANGLDLWSMIKRAVSERLGRMRLFEGLTRADLHLVSRAQLERRVDRAA
jgi:hypothetical protein